MKSAELGMNEQQKQLTPFYKKFGFKLLMTWLMIVYVLFIPVLAKLLWELYKICNLGNIDVVAIICLIFFFLVSTAFLVLMILRMWLGDKFVMPW